MGFVVGKEEFLTVVESQARELVLACMEVFGMYGTSSSMRPKQFQACCIPVDCHVWRNLVAATAVGDLEDIMDGGLFKVGQPARTGVYAWLRTGGQWSPLLFFFLAGDVCDLGIDIVLD